ncbi:MAG: VTT domain-containing protein [Thermoleophilia bacterium]
MGIPSSIGYGALAALVGAESAGLPVPGETALLTAALLAAAGHLSIPLVIGVAAAAAIVGDNIGYWIGRKGGRRALVASRGPFRAHRQRALERGEAFFARHGSKAVFVSRWIPGVRVVAAVVAGATRMPIRGFAVANALGALAWAATTALVVYTLGPVGGAVVLVASGAVAGAGVAMALIMAPRRRQTGQVAVQTAEP